MFKRIIVGAAVLLGQSACLTSLDQPTPSSVHDDQPVSDSPTAVRPVQPSDSTSLWMQYGDPSVLAANAQNLGPLEVSSKRHGCNKFKFHTLGDVMSDLGVNMLNSSNPTPPAGTASLLPLESFYKPPASLDCNTLVPNIPSGSTAMDVAAHISQSARYLYCASRLTLGMPPYAARLSESTVLTTAGATKLFDTLAAAANEIAATNLSKAARCTDKNGVAAVLFNTDNTCNAAGVSCLQGYPPSAEQMNLCNRMVQESVGSAAMNVKLNSGATVAVAAVDNITAGKRIATAAILANALLCE